MDAANLDRLHTADDPNELEAPMDFKYHDALARVQHLKSILEHYVGQQFDMDTNVQDASYFTELSLRDQQAQDHPLVGRVYYQIFAVRFSAFGNLFTVYGNSPTTRLDSDMIAHLILTIQQYGFLYVDTAVLATPYSGKNTTFKERVREATWWDRFFDYL